MVGRGGFGDCTEGAEIDLARLIEVHGEEVVRLMSQDASELMISIQRLADSGGLGGRHSEVLRLTGKPTGEDPQKRERDNSSVGSDSPPLKKPEAEIG